LSLCVRFAGILKGAAKTLSCHLLIVAGTEFILTLIKSLLEGFSLKT